MNLAVIGVGLIGGSVGMAARAREGARVTGWDPDPDALSAAREHGALDAAAGTLAEAVAEADLAVVAAPVSALVGCVDEVLRAATEACTVTDVGSTKRALVESVADPRFVGGHPLAGAEAAGVRHARGDLFEDATWYVTPGPATEGIRLERLHRFLAGLGARPAVIDAGTHDRLMAAFSHLPHVVANVLVDQAAEALEGEAIPATGPSFRDATRVAGANPGLWTGIYESNRDALVERLDRTIELLGLARDRIAGGDALATWQQDAAVRRTALLDVGLTGGPLREIRVVVPNRPGVVADLALALGRAGVNIHDLSLSPSPDNRSGEVAIYVAEEHAERAQELVAEVVR